MNVKKLFKLISKLHGNVNFSITIILNPQNVNLFTNIKKIFIHLGLKNTDKIGILVIYKKLENLRILDVVKIT